LASARVVNTYKGYFWLLVHINPPKND